MNLEEETTHRTWNLRCPFRFYRFPILLPDRDQSAEKHQEQTSVSMKRKITTDTLSSPNINHLPKPRKLISNREISSAVAAINLRRMRNYSREDIAEEKRLGVTTRLSLYKDPWKMTKKLTKSDLGGNSRLMLELKWAKKYLLPYLDIKQVESEPGVPVRVLDFDTDTEHLLRFKLWKSSHCYVFKGGWVKDFVRRRELKKDDEIGMFCDRPSMGAPYSTLRICFRVLRRACSSQT